jgi:hypothetical protein
MFSDNHRKTGAHVTLRNSAIGKEYPLTVESRSARSIKPNPTGTRLYDTVLPSTAVLRSVVIIIVHVAQPLVTLDCRTKNTTPPSIYLNAARERRQCTSHAVSTRETNTQDVPGKTYLSTWLCYLEHSFSLGITFCHQKSKY